jgi:hypothetical protein
LIPGLDGPSDNVDEVQIASLHIKTSTWTVFGTHAKFPATAYVNIEISCGVSRQSGAASSDRGSWSASTRPIMGQLHDLAVVPSLAGPGVLIKRYGNSTNAELTPGEKWTYVLHIGIQETSLASRLSTSFKSLGGRLGRISNVEVINRWLDVLQKDTTAQSQASKAALQVKVKVAFKHSLLPASTTLLEERVVQITMTEDEVERAKIWDGKLGYDSEDEEEERVQELRVMGAPWL